VWPEGLGKFKNRLIGNRTYDLPVCSIVPQGKIKRDWNKVQLLVFRKSGRKEQKERKKG
jgi:hypothetical protein